MSMDDDTKRLVDQALLARDTAIEALRLRREMVLSELATIDDQIRKLGALPGQDDAAAVPRRMARGSLSKAVLDLVSGRPGLTLRDIADAMPAYSLSAIQASLALSMKRGTIVRSGFRGEYRYSTSANPAAEAPSEKAGASPNTERGQRHRVIRRSTNPADLIKE